MAVKKVILVMATVLFAVGIISTASFAAEDNPVLNSDPGDALKKLGRGVANMLTFPLELPNQMTKINKSDGPVAALTYGFMKGCVAGVFRLIVGVYEVISFPIPLPEFYRPIMTDPEYMLQDLDI